MSDDAHRYCGGYYDAHTCGEIDSLTERAEKAEAQVQAVRDVCEGVKFQYWKVSRGGILLTPPWIDVILRALDGTDE